MTVQPHGQNNALALPDDFDDGLGDFDSTDAAVPRLTIVHKEAMFKESLSGTKYQALSVIILGLVKQRTLWDTQQEDDMKPLCKSPDFQTGWPNLDRNNSYPFNKVSFDVEDLSKDAFGRPIIDCASCPLKDWGSHPNGKIPWCSEEWTLPVLYDTSGDGDWMPALLTIKKTGLKNLRQYLASFQRGKKPAFEKVTTITLRQESRGQTDYCVPEWQAGALTDGSDWAGFSQTFVGLRDFLKAAPAAYDEEGNRLTLEDHDGHAAPAAAQQPQQQAPAQQAAPAATAPAAPSLARQAAPATKPVSTAPVAQPDDDVVDAEVIEEEAQQEQAQPATAPVESSAAPAAEDDDELPF